MDVDWSEVELSPPVSPAQVAVGASGRCRPFVSKAGAPGRARHPALLGGGGVRVRFALARSPVGTTPLRRAGIPLGGAIHPTGRQAGILPSTAPPATHHAGGRSYRGGAHLGRQGRRQGPLPRVCRKGGSRALLHVVFNRRLSGEAVPRSSRSFSSQRGTRGRPPIRVQPPGSSSGPASFHQGKCFHTAPTCRVVCRCPCSSHGLLFIPAVQTPVCSS